MKHFLSTLTLALISQSLSANNILIDGDFEDQAQSLIQYNHQSYPWELVDYLDEYTAVGGQFKPSESQFENAEALGNVVFVRNGAIRQKLNTTLLEDETYRLSLRLGRKQQGDFPAYRIGLQSGNKFIELANEYSHGIPNKGSFKTVAINFTPNKAHFDFTSGYEDVYLVVEALSERGNAQLFADNILFSEGYANYKPTSLDADNDGIMDEWERSYSLDPGNAADASADYDQDGVSNYDEYLAGTDPWDITDNLHPYNQEQVQSLSESSEVQNTLLTRMPIEIIGIRLIPISEPPITCSTEGEGALYYDTIAQMTMVCNGTEWSAIEGEDLVDDADADASNELLESIAFDSESNMLTLTEAGQSYSVDLTVLSADSDDTNEIQTLSKQGSTVSLSLDGGSFTDEVDDADADATNELQTITLSDDTVTLSQNGGSFSINDADSDSSNELITEATFAAETGTLTIIDAGNTYVLDLNSLGDDGDADATNEIQLLSVIDSTLSLSNGGGSVSINDADSDPLNEIQTLSKTDNTVTLTLGGGSFVDAVDDADADASNELQTITKSGNSVTLSNGGGSFIDEVDDADADASNELQSISKSGNTVTLSNGGGSFVDEVDDADADASNELQSVSITGSTVTLSNSGGSFSINDADSSTSNELQTISKTGSIVTLSRSGGSFTDEVEDADADASNELQTVSLSGTTVTLSNNGGSFSINDADSSTSNELQTLSKTGNTVTLSNGGGSISVADNDSSSTNEIQTLSKTGNTVTLSRSGGSVSIDDGDSDATNEIQTLSADGATITLSNGGGSVNVNVADGDSSSTNELQTVSKSGSTVTLSRSGGSFSINDNDANDSNELISTVSFNNSNRQISINESGNTKSVTLTGMATETYVDNAIASATSSAKTGALYVYDGSGSTKIGRFLRTGENIEQVYNWVLVPSSGIPQTLDMLSGGDTKISGQNMYFSGSNCTGTLYYNTAGITYHPAYNDGRLYESDTSVATSTKTYKSYLLYNSGSCTNSTSSRTLRPAKTVNHSVCGDYVCKIIEE